MRLLILVAGLMFVHASANCQEGTIRLQNPSFEGIAQCCKPPFHWEDCGAFIDETPPDVHPSGAFEVNMDPYHQDTYLGMVVRDNNTWECVSTHLPNSLKAVDAIPLVSS